MSASAGVSEQIKNWEPLLEPYGLTDFNQKGGGADIGPLESFGVPLIGFLPDFNAILTTITRHGYDRTKSASVNLN
jgi:hypothetical protein